MSVSLVLKVGAALGVGGLVYWAFSRWSASSANAAGGAGASTTTKDSIPGAMPNAMPDPKPYSPPKGPSSTPKDYTGLTGTTHGADDVGGTVLSKKGIEANILADERASKRSGYLVSPTLTWRDPGDNSLYAIWFRQSDGVRGVFYDGVFRRV